MIEIFDILISESFWNAALRIATPLIFGVLGALICERAGVLNLGIEGIFVAGAMAGWLAAWVGVWPLGRALWSLRSPGGFFGLIHAILTVPMGLSQHVSGLGITMFATSVSYFIYRTALPKCKFPTPYRAFSTARYPYSVRPCHSLAPYCSNKLR